MGACPSDDRLTDQPCPVGQLGVQGQWHRSSRTTRHAPPRPWFMRRTPSSKSPSMSLKAAYEQVAERVAAEIRRAASPPGYRYCSRCVNGGLGVRTAPAKAVPDVAHRRQADGIPQATRRPPVVGHGHDRRQVARVGLQPAQERRQAGPAAIGHDAWSACQRALADQGDRRAAHTGRRGGSRSVSSRCSEPEDEDDQADREQDHDPQPRRQELEGQEPDDRGVRSAARGATSRTHLAEHQRAGDGDEAASPRKMTMSQRLRPMPGRSSRRNRSTAAAGQIDRARAP
jgi:hypothetical protein